MHSFSFFGTLFRIFNGIDFFNSSTIRQFMKRPSRENFPVTNKQYQEIFDPFVFGFHFEGFSLILKEQLVLSYLI